MDYPDEAGVLRQGFRFRPVWWSSRVPAEWGGFLNQLPAESRGYHRISRSDLLTTAGEHGLPQALLAGYVWGTGESAFLVGRRARVFRDNEPARIGDALVSVAEQLQVGSTADAYRSMLRGDVNYLKHLGPSFSLSSFTPRVPRTGNQGVR